MITILSPAKNLNFKQPSHITDNSQPRFINESSRLIRTLKKLKPSDLKSLMNISDKLAVENFERFKAWKPEFSLADSKQAMLAFNGEVYYGIRAAELTREQWLFAQDHVRILSGLHGILRPLDLIRPYRLEMGSDLHIGKKEGLYAFWGKKIQQALKSDLGEDRVIVNLASQEYSRAALLPGLRARVITPVFKDLKGDEYKVIFVYAKRARGLMTRFIVDNRITDPEQLKLFDSNGYFYNENLSEGDTWVFTR